jgi:hypothetical protein
MIVIFIQESSIKISSFIKSWIVSIQKEENGQSD